MVNTAEADVICPSVAAEDPYGLLGKEFLVVNDILAVLTIDAVESGNKRISSSAVLRSVIDCVKISLGSRLDLIGGLVAVSDSLNLSYEPVANCVLTEEHTVTVLCVILEQGVCPCGTVTVLVNGIG